MKQIKNVCVLGAGAMGRQIALNAAVAGFQVALSDSFPEVLAGAGTWSRSYLEKSVAKGKMAAADAEAALSRVVFHGETAPAVQHADLVIEAIIEDEQVKRALLIEVNAYAPADAIITTNSSYIASSHFADLIAPAGRLANLHFFNPAMRMELVEIVRGPHTDEETVQALKAYVLAIGKRAIVVNQEIEGFVVNRLLRALQNEAFSLYESGIASFEDIDTGAELGLNHPLGPFRLLDLTGIDICYKNRQSKFERTGDPKDEPPAFLVEKYQSGALGRKTGKGWYDYTKK